LSAFVDSNILVRHLTGEPDDMAQRATAFLANADELLLVDLILAETIYVLESFYKAPRPQIADAMRSLIAMSCVVTIDPALLLRALEVYELERIDFAEAYLVAQAETSGVGTVVSFDKSIDRVKTIQRVEPPEIKPTASKGTASANSQRTPCSPSVRRTRADAAPHRA
jgi:predicted nucleic-acid-binding protein